MFSAGSVFVNLGAHLVREGFEGFNREVSGAQRVKEHYVRLGGNLSRTGFEGYRRLLAQSQADTERFSVAARGSLEGVNISMRSTSQAAARYLGSTRAQLGLLAGEYGTIAEAAEHSAARQRHAMESSVAPAAALEEKAGVAGAAAGKSFGRQFGKAADIGRWTLIGGAVGAGVSMKWATDFQKNMLLLRTEAGYTINGKGSQPGVKQLSKAVLDLAPTVGFGPNKLAEGLYHVASAGIKASSAMDVLKVAAEGARIGNADLQDVTRQLTSIIEAQPKDIHNASEAMGVLIRIVGHGNLRMKDLIAAMGSGIVPTAASVGLGLRDVGAALDTLTARGIPAEQGATRLRTTLQLMADPTHKAAGALAKIGLDSEAVAKAFHSPRGIVAGLELIHKHLEERFPQGHALTHPEFVKAIADYNHQLDEMGVRGRTREQDMKDFKRRLEEVGTAAIQQNKTLVDAFGGARMGSTMITLMNHIDDVRHRMKGIGTDSGGAVKELNSAVQQYHKTFAFQFQQFWAAVQKVGIQFGTAILPDAIKFLHTLEDIGHWLGKHETAAKSLAAVFGGILLAAVVAWGVRFTKSTAEALTQLYKFITTLGGARTKFLEKTAAVEEGSAAERAAIQRTTVALMEQAQAAGLATEQMGRLALTGEAVTAGGVVLPKGMARGGVSSVERAVGGQAVAGEAVAAETGLARGGLMARAGGFMRGAVGRAGSGMMIGLGGTMAAQIVGHVIGGKTGSAVSGIGSAAATGAGIGMLLGPEGALAGGVIGGLIGGFHHFLGGKHGEDYGKQVAKQFKDGMGNLRLNISAPTAAHTQKVMQDAGKRIEDIRKRMGQHQATTRDPVTGVRLELDPHWKADLAKDRRDLQEQFNKIGRAAAESFNDGMRHGPKYQTEGTMFSSVRIALNSLPRQSRQAALHSMLQMSATMEEQGKLPRGATNKLVRDIIKSYGYLSPQLKDMTHKAMADIETEIAQGKAVDKTQQMVDQIGKTFASAPKVGKVNAHNVRKVWEEEMEFLKRHMHSGTTSMQEDAATLWSQMHKDAKKYSRLMRVDVDKEMSTMEGAVSGSMGDLSGSVNDAVTSVGTAADTIATNINKLAKELGAKGIHFTPAKTPRGRQKQSNVFGGPGGGRLPSASTELDAPGAVGGLATGGIPNPYGSSHDDHVVVGPQGPVALISGTEGILNTPQMDVVDASLRLASQIGMHPYGSLSSLWGSGMRHYAEGGMLERANYLDRLHLPYVWGGHHGERGAIHNPRPGLDCSSTVSYVLGIPPRVSGAMAGVGKPGPGAITIFYNDEHTFMRLYGRYFGTSGFGHPKAGTGAAWFTQHPSSDYLRRFHSRHVDSSFGGIEDLMTGSITGPPGANKRIARAAVAREAHQGSSFVNRMLAKLDNASGQPLGDFSASAASPAQAKRWTRQAMAIAGVSGHMWEDMLLRQESRESSFNPNAVNTTDINFQRGDPSKGIGQITGSNFRTYMMHGHGNILHPVDNLIAVIRYIIATYGGGNADRAARVMWARGGGAYRLGGLLRRFQRGGHLAATHPGHPAHPHARLATAHPPHLGVVPRSHTGLQHEIRPKPPRRKRPINRAHSGPQVLPHHLSSLQKYSDLPGIGPIDDADTAIKAVDATYSEKDRYFQIVDAQLTPEDTAVLLGLRTQQGTALQSELVLENTAGTTLEAAAASNKAETATTRAHAHHVLRELNILKKKLVNEGRRLAKLRHHRAGHMLTIADTLARRISENADHRSALAKRERDIRTSYDNRIARLMGEKPGDISAALAGVDAKYEGHVRHAQRVAPSKLPGIRDQIKREKLALRLGHKARQDAHSGKVRALLQARRHALDPLIERRAGLVDHARHIREDESKQRRKYQRKGWHDVWDMTLHKWHLQDGIKRLREEEKHLSGSTTEVGSGGILGKLVKQGSDIDEAKAAVEGRKATTQQDIVDNALNQMDLAGQQAQSTADRDQKPEDLWDFLPPGVSSVLSGIGISPDDMHRIYQPAPKDAAAEASGAPSAADVATAALAQLSSMETASRSLYTQFGSNVVGASDEAIRRSLSGAPFGGGVRFFGAAGAAINAGLGLTPTGVDPHQEGREGSNIENNFYQTNHYSRGPEDPHIHAQASRSQFETTFG